MSKKKARFKVGQVVWLKERGEYQKIREVFVSQSSGTVIYKFVIGGEWDDQYESDCRPLTTREQGPRRRGK